MTKIGSIVILAAGQGTRMKSKKAKVLHSFAGRTLLSHAIHTAIEANPERIVLVVRHQAEAVAAEAKRVYPDIVIAHQDEVPGTGRAVWCALQKLQELGDNSGTLVVTSADVPLMEASTIQSLAETRQDEASALCLLTTEISNPFGYGRIQRIAGQVAGIVEERDATYAQKQIKEVNAGIYAFDFSFLEETLPQLSGDNAQGEIYLTDTIKVAHANGRKVSSVLLADTAQAEGCNDRAQLAELRAEYNRRRTRYWMLHGVTINDPSTTWIDADVTIGPDTTLYPNTQLRGTTTVGEDCRIGPDSTLIDVQIADAAEVFRVHGISAKIGSRTFVGPFTSLLPGSVIADGAHVGAFCEIKDVEVKAGTKIPHLAFVGKAKVGAKPQPQSLKNATKAARAEKTGASAGSKNPPPAATKPQPKPEAGK